MKLLWDIFWVFFKINLLSFGGVFGVLPELERMIVVEHGWISHERFIQSYVVSQFVPGPNMAMCPLIGYWVAGTPGWFAGFFGIYLCPLFVMALAYALFARYRELAWVQRVERGFRPLVFGLMLSSCARLWWLQSAGVDLNPARQGLARALAALLAVGSFWLYARGRLTAMKLIFAMGGVWWLMGSLLLK